jgi:hypothetical protein
LGEDRRAVHHRDVVVDRDDLELSLHGVVQPNLVLAAVVDLVVHEEPSNRARVLGEGGEGGQEPAVTEKALGDVLGLDAVEQLHALHPLGRLELARALPLASLQCRHGYGVPFSCRETSQRLLFREIFVDELVTTARLAREAQGAAHEEPDEARDEDVDRRQEVVSDGLPREHERKRQEHPERERRGGRGGR